MWSASLRSLWIRSSLLRAPRYARPVSSLARLPKAPRFTALQFRDVTPGSTAYVRSNLPPPLPLGTGSSTISRAGKYPLYQSEMFSIKMVPFKDLPRHSNDSPNPYDPPLSRGRPDQLRLSLVFFGGPTTLHKSGAIRTTIRRRLKEALKLVITRGAKVDDKGNMSLEETETGPEKWLVEDSTYVFRPSLLPYKAPLLSIVEDLRNGLIALKDASVASNKKLSRTSQTSAPGSPMHFGRHQ